MNSIVILAAGAGSRCGLGYNKILYEINSKMLIEYTLDLFKDDEVILVVHENEYELFSKLFNCKIVIGGLTRQESVFNGVSIASNENILVHDGARIFVDFKLIELVKNGLNDFNAVCPVIPITDSIKDVNGRNVNRKQYFLAQTPQGIKKSLYLDCYDNSIEYSDDVSVLEIAGYKVSLVEGNKANFKITTIDDIQYAKYILGDDKNDL